MEEDINIHISNYETLKRNKHVIKSIDKEYFFEFVDCLIKGYRDLEEKNKEIQDTKKEYYSLINKIENKIDKFDYKFEKAKKRNDKDRADYYWDLIGNFKKLLEV